MKSSISHIQINVRPQNLAFYKDLLKFLGWSVIYEDATTVGVAEAQGASLWFAGQIKSVENDYDGPGMNHLGMNSDTKEGVDEVVAYLKEKGVPSLFETPRHRPEFCSNPDRDYYQVMFESPDRVLFEVVYTGPLAK